MARLRVDSQAMRAVALPGEVGDAEDPCDRGARQRTAVRVFVVLCEEREVYEGNMRELSMERTRQDLMAL